MTGQADGQDRKLKAVEAKAKDYVKGSGGWVKNCKQAAMLGVWLEPKSGYDAMVQKYKHQ